MNESQRQRAVTRLEEFLNTPLDEWLSRHRTLAPEQAALRLFAQVAGEVPAYADFLAGKGIDPAAVQSFDDFRGLPLTTKDNYLRHYPLARLCRQGRLEDCDMIAVSSGSTGEPTFWPRSVSDEYSVALRFEQVFHDSFHADTRRTLALVCFSLGTWIGGMYTADCCRHLAAKGYPITVATPGNNKNEIFRVIDKLGGLFDQIVLLGYPPFIKDVIDSGRAQGVDWTRLNTRLVFAGEVFSEEWRGLVCERAGATQPCYDTAALYGTADAGVLGNETPLSIAIRRHLARHPELARELFGKSRLPTLAQYDPLARFFEVSEGTLLFSGDHGIPLVRYHIADEGGIIPCDELLAHLNARGFDPVAELGGWGARGVRDLPFVYVFGRSHFVVSYFGANVYPENIAVGLEQPDVRDWVTGKFVMEVREGADRNVRLAIVIELAPGEAASEARRSAAARSIERELCRLNSEYANYVPAEYRPPHVELKPAGDPEWFPPGVKHRYTRGR